MDQKKNLKKEEIKIENTFVGKGIKQINKKLKKDKRAVILIMAVAIIIIFARFQTNSASFSILFTACFILDKRILLSSVLCNKTMGLKRPFVNSS